jgi:hypothetical protein
MHKYVNRLIVLGIMALTLASCNYLDIVPENVSTVDDMFADRYAAEKSLASCYWALPRTGGSWDTNPAILGSLEGIFNREHRTIAGMRIGLGENNATSPIMNYWNDGGDGTRSVYAGIRDCNTFLDNIEKVKDLPNPEKKRMIAEVTLLKAYMHFQLIYFYGPICPLRTSPPVDESTQGVRVYREKIDDCFQYVLDLVDEAIESNDLPSVIPTCRPNWDGSLRLPLISSKQKFWFTGQVRFSTETPITVIFLTIMESRFSIRYTTANAGRRQPKLVKRLSLIARKMSVTGYMTPPIISLLNPYRRNICE